MKILIIGGTRFLGRALTECALERGHSITLFHRGQTNPDLFPHVEHIHGDRTADLSKLSDRKWDAVIDTCGYVPRIVRMTAETLVHNVGRYLFISSISVYKDLGADLDESSSLGTLEDEETEEITGESYGPLKALCEQVVQEFYQERALIVRPGLIVGPHDPTDRFTYWPVRMEAGGEVLAPDRKGQPVQFIDVRDLSAWAIALLENNSSGVFNGTGPQGGYLLGEVIERVHKTINPESIIVWIDTAFLEEHGVQPWSDLPLVLSFDGSTDGMGRADVSKAVASGLKLRALEDTVRDTLEWAKGTDVSGLKSGLKIDQERGLLEAYASSKQNPN